MYTFVVSVDDKLVTIVISVKKVVLHLVKQKVRIDSTYTSPIDCIYTHRNPGEYIHLPWIVKIFVKR